MSIRSHRTTEGRLTGHGSRGAPDALVLPAQRTDRYGLRAPAAQLSPRWAAAAEPGDTSQGQEDRQCRPSSFSGFFSLLSRSMIFDGFTFIPPRPPPPTLYSLDLFFSELVFLDAQM